MRAFSERLYVYDTDVCVALPLQEEKHGVQDVVDALVFMADYCLAKEPPRLGDAEMYAMRLQDFGGPAKDKGRRVIDRVQQRRLDAGGPQHAGQPGAG